MENLMEPDQDPNPNGSLTLQIVAMPSDTNQFGDIYGGWLTAKMDLAGSVASARIARGRVATVAIDNISFLAPIKTGSLVSCYTRVRGLGRSSVKVSVEAWIRHAEQEEEWVKISEGRFTFVAIDDNGRTRSIPRNGA